MKSEDYARDLLVRAQSLKLLNTGLPVGMEFAALGGKDHELLSLGLTLEKVLGPVPAPKV